MIQPKLNWRKAEEHPEKFEDGERMMVYESEMFHCTFIHGNQGKPFWWDNGVKYWLPLSELEATLPEE